MRRGNEPELLYDEQGNVIAVNLSWDFTAEHEWGIEKTRAAFGVTNGGEGLWPWQHFGIGRRKVRKVPATKKAGISQVFEWVEIPAVADRAAMAGFVLWQTYDARPFNYDHWKSELDPWRCTLVAAWCDGMFCALSTDTKEQQALKTIFEHVEQKDACIFLSGRTSPWARSGLVIAITSRLPQGTGEEWEKFDREQFELKKAFEQSGIEEFLKKRGCKWFFLGQPSRKEDGTLQLWLNPMEQDKFASGWFTVEELKQWPEGKGPVIMKEKTSEPVR